MTPQDIGSDIQTPSPAPGDHNHFHLLDVLRGVAITLVIGHHVAVKFPATVKDPIAEFLKHAGWAGVDLFFAISGFLITSILYKTRDRDGIKGFFIKRFFRIVPLYLVALIVYATMSVVTHHEVDLLHRLWMNLIFLTAWVIPIFGREGVPYDITWSLSVEEFAYLTLGLFCLASLARRSRLRPFLWFLIGLALAVRCVVILERSFDPLALYFFAPARIDSIAFGGVVALGFCSSLTSHRFARPVLMAAVLCILIVFGLLTRHNLAVQLIGYTVFGLAAALLVGSLSLWRGKLKDPLTRLLAWIGRVSYFVYLFHMFIVAFLMSHAFAPLQRAIGYWGLYAAVIAATCAVAAVSWRYFEKPLIDRGRLLADGPSRYEKQMVSTPE